MSCRYAVYVVAGMWLVLGCSPQPTQNAPGVPDRNEPVSPQGTAPDPTQAPPVDSGPPLPSSPDDTVEASPFPQRPPSQFVVPSYSDWGLQETVADSLGRIGEPAVPALVRMLRHPDADRRIQAADILARIGPQAHEAVPGLVETLQDPDQKVRKAVARALGQIGAGAADAVGPLLEVLEETSAASPPPESTLR